MEKAKDNRCRVRLHPETAHFLKRYAVKNGRTLPQEVNQILSLHVRALLGAPRLIK